jgi:hypothetical protein
MKKIILCLSVCIITVNAIAQKSDVKPNVIKVNPLGIVVGQASVAFEHAIGEKNSVVIAPTFGGYKLAGFKYSAFGIGAEYRFYISNTKTAPAGFYAAPGLGFNSGKVKESSSNTEAKFTTFNVKAVIGNQWIFPSGFVIDLNGGIQYGTYKYTDNSSSVFSGLKASGVFPALNFSLGYNF